jgi:hypothetical protein
MHGFVPLACLMQPVEEILQLFLKCVGGHFVSNLLMCASCFSRCSFSRNPIFQQINSITKQLGQHLHCSIHCMRCGSMLIKSAVLCVSLKLAWKGLRLYSQSYTHLYESSRTEFNYSLQFIFQRRLRNFRWHCFTGESRNTLCSIN